MKNRIVILAMALCIMGCGSGEKPEKFGKTDARLFLGDGEDQPLLVGLGGSEGGNAWDSDRWKPTRGQFITAGYAFLALEYFGGPNTPEKLDRISLEGVHDAIIEASKNPRINSTKICLVGASKGAELALLLASKYDDITCVVAIVPGKAAFPALTISATTSSWSYNNEEVPFVPMPWSAVPAASSGDLRKAFTIMLEDTVAVQPALIEVEKINGPLLLVSATEDEMWPSTEMSNEVMQRLKVKRFNHPYQHLIIDGGHREPLKHFDEVIDFLKHNWF